MSDEEWGNLGDFDANDTRAAVRAANRKKAKEDKEWQKNIRAGVNKRSQDDSWRKNVAAANKAKAQDEDWLEKQRKKNVEQAQDPKWLKNVRTANKAKAQDEDWLKKVRAKNSIQAENPLWLEKVRQGAIKNQKEIVTPYGTFESCNAAGKVIGTSRLNRKLKSLPHLYYFTTEGPGEIPYEEVLYTPYGHCRYGVSRVEKDTVSVSTVHALAQNDNEEEALRDRNNAGRWAQKKLREDPENYYVKTEPRREWLLEDNSE